MENILDYCTISGESVKKYEGSKRYVATGDVIENKIINSSEVDYMNKPSRANQIAKVGDLLFAKMKETKKVIKIDEDNSKNIYSTGFFVIRPNEGILTDYIYWVLNSPKFNRDKDRNCKGATQKALNNEGLKKIKINKIPDIVEQQKIVSKLNKINKIITKKKNQLNMLDELIKSQFVEMFKREKINKKGWLETTIGEHIRLLTDFSANGSYKILDSKVIMYDELNYAYMVRTIDLENKDYKNKVKYITKETYEFLSKSKVYPNDIIMNKIGSAGKVYIMPNLDIPVTLGRNAFLIRFNDKILPIYIYYLLTSEYGKKQIQRCVRGAVTKTITKEDVRKIKIIVPPINLQNQFAEIVKQIDKQKFEIEKSLKKTQELYESLMEKYFD